MSQQASPRGTFLKIADAIKADIKAKPDMTELPSLGDIVTDHGVSRGVAIRAFKVLREDGVAEPVAGGRWRVIRAGESVDRRSLADRIAELIKEAELEAGDPFPSTSALAARFDVSRPTVTKALDKLEAAGLLSEARQGKQRTVLALPGPEERAEA
ncbi:GntR family transcriptional regulator [Streptomyces sp. NBC_00467]|uniref:GntR family transcriptional regulator n=1 Tax=Streptomyces sp. NBC_00467 TaxID=2975752 RepID=UPI002E182ED9